jgi:UPF0755 protein
MSDKICVGNKGDGPMGRFLGFAATAMAVLLLGVAGWFFCGTQERYKGYSETEKWVEIPIGTNVSAIARRLEEAGVIRTRHFFMAAVFLQDAYQHLKAGQYRFVKPLSPADVVEKLEKGEWRRSSIQFREGLTILEMAQIYATKGWGSADSFLTATRSVHLINSLDQEAKDLEGYLFPDTYIFSGKLPANELVSLMVKQFWKNYETERSQVSQEQSLTMRQIVTLASLIEKETSRDDERPLVAAVFLNRLRMGIPLQCDPTVIFALRQAGAYTGNLTRKDLQISSPYNTYQNRGLPPGPIASPGRESLRAALNPADVTYLYFVSRNDGTHDFSTTLREHIQKVQKYQLKKAGL